jgi:dihydrodipicolinate synthase/N-acetylneuraminate lyase
MPDHRPQLETAAQPPVLPNRTILGMSAVLLPFDPSGNVAWDTLTGLLERTLEARLVPAVNMDTGYVQLLDAATRERVLEVTSAAAVPGGFVAGAVVTDTPGSGFNHDGYLREMERVAKDGGTPIVFPSYGLNALDNDDWVAAHVALARDCDRFIGFELGSMFVPYGRVYSLDAYRGILEIPACIGAKHSSLSRQMEWDRLALRDQFRPDFHVFTGNDLAIDMVCYGSDYLLGLSAFAPDVFAERDRRWVTGDPSFHELNDILQYLGFFSFRPPVPAYRHDAALFLELRGWIDSDATPPGAHRRPDTDIDILRDIGHRLGVLP